MGTTWSPEAKTARSGCGICKRDERGWETVAFESSEEVDRIVAAFLNWHGFSTFPRSNAKPTRSTRLALGESAQEEYGRSAVFDLRMLPNQSFGLLPSPVSDFAPRTLS